jgi:hypothetical protein
MDEGDVIRRDPLAFLPGVAEQLGWYVYALRDPRDGAVFYAGKGIGNRVYEHARQVRKLAGQSSDQLKLATIRDIHDAGLEVEVEIIRHRIPDEKSAYEVEAAVIDTLALMGSDLTNLVGGHGAERGWGPLEDIVAEYAAEPVEIAPDHRVALIRIRRRFAEVRTPQDLYEVTRQWWVVAPNRRKPDYAFSVYNGIVRAVYKINSWEQEPPGGRDRWRFDGERSLEMEDRYLWKDVSGYLSTGAQNPIKYVNC